MTRELAGIGEWADRYDGYIVDLWGVVHDGVTPFPAALACLRALRAAGKRVVLLSNAPRRAAAAAAALRELGVPDGLYDALITSGEITYRALRTRPDTWFRALGQRVYHLGPPRDRSVLDGLELTEADTPDAASFVLNTGPDDQRGPADPAAFEDVLGACRAAALPMLCANPDLVVVRDGQRIICAGTLAERYGALGGEVRSIGKPDPAIYTDVLAALGTPRVRTLAIGDSLRTDIAGAAAAKIDAVWIRGGIHRGENTAAALATHTLRPAGTMDLLVW